MSNLIKNSDPDAMLKISKKITAYADTLKKDMKKLSQTHQGMQANWSGKQYDDFSKAIENANATISKQVEKLLLIASDVEKHAIQLKKAQDVGLS